MQAPLEAIHEYYAAFSTLNLSAIVSHYSEPTMAISPQGVVSAADRTALAAFLTPMIEGLRARAYARSEFTDAQVTMIGESNALVQGTAVRFAASGSEMEKIALGYLMHRTDAGWKIAALVVPQ